MSLHIPRIPGIDFAANGKQLGYLEIEHSDNENDAAVIPSPIAVISGGDGPTVLLVAGTHGDEYEGQVLLQELIRSLNPDEVSGRLIILPALNITAVREGSRVSTVDRVNLNRALPGRADGGPTQQIASIVAEELIPMADFVMDIHSGGIASEYVPSAFVYQGPTPELWAEKRAAVAAFNAPYSVVVKPMLKAGSISGAADRAGVPMISTELGGGGTVSLPILKRARRGLRALLGHWGVLKDAAAAQGAHAAGIPGDAEPIQWIELVPQSPVNSTMAGLFEPVVELGQHVRAGDLVARVHAVEELDRPSKDFFAPIDGVVAIVRRPTRVNVGTTMVNIAVDHGTTPVEGNHEPS
ncbi:MULTISPECIES: succinylglutamate desuccinylase/aspartoacylase family protein [Arthrobacter]|uniref:Succinylglutamate desuccinylase n=1 Tax=Arthrobacter terricola TaxID=2547396 RepID=A0A4R5KQ06_9MICC|nr:MULTISPECIES: succinylglutamate desuccinylase/aspartoacylase family protein [Arthrobacter]MBT8160662.1 succinylglutamate desuccinylase/aspartoacylase family protein [Arthrobacter sp. GN70]TDF97819.1 succinylglutamate desuccinylase [Arthrobacter terricola]